MQIKEYNEKEFKTHRFENIAGTVFGQNEDDYIINIFENLKIHSYSYKVKYIK